MKNISIALDGPAGAGKSTIAKLIAEKNNLIYIDTGAMYRAITLKIICCGIDINDKKAIEKILSQTKIDIKKNNVFLDGKIVTEKIRKPEINKFVSYVAKVPLIREKMVEFQRKIAVNKNVIMDGRDIATNILPDARHKFFLTASIEERAKRRFIELKQKNFQVTLKEIKEEIKNRDKIDMEREIAPLRKVEDAILIDTTGKSIDEVVQEMQSYLNLK
jgi:cytidylate kinase